MPSIRIRSSPYPTLRDHDIPVNRELTPLANLFVVHGEPITSTPPFICPVTPRMRRSMPTLRSQAPSSLSIPPHSPTNRPRSSTTTSRVHKYFSASAGRYHHAAAVENDENRIYAAPTTYSQHIAAGRPLGDGYEGPNSIGSTLNLPTSKNRPEREVHDDHVIEHLDVIDPQFGAASNLTNAVNTIIFPPLSWYSRKPMLMLTPPSPVIRTDELDIEKRDEVRFTDSLDQHVDDVLRRPSKFKRTSRGIYLFLKTPMGVITAIYGFLVVFWGAAIVLFAAKIINLHNLNKQGLWIEISSQIENGLFTVTGIGLIPSRVLDTYRIYWIWYYKRKTRNLRLQAGLPQLCDVDDLPDPTHDPNYVHVLTEEEENHLHKQQRKFQHNQTWYRPHGTETHREFPINIALLICLLIDGNSVFQVMLCGTMWGLDRFHRPAWSTGVLISCSFLCGIVAATLIWRGSQETKRVAEVEERLRAALSDEGPDCEVCGERTQATSGHSATRQVVSQLEVDEVEDSGAAVDEHVTIPPS